MNGAAFVPPTEPPRRSTPAVERPRSDAAKLVIDTVPPPRPVAIVFAVLLAGAGIVGGLEIADPGWSLAPLFAVGVLFGWIEERFRRPAPGAVPRASQRPHWLASGVFTVAVSFLSVTAGERAIELAGAFAAPILGALLAVLYLVQDWRQRHGRRTVPRKVRSRPPLF